MLVCILRLCLQNVAVSKSRHRLLFYPTGKEKNTYKFLFQDFEYGGQIVEREGINTLSICGFPRALRYLLIFKLLVCACFEKVLLRDDSCISHQECDEVCLKIILKSVCVNFFCFEQVLKISTYSKKDCSFSFPLDSAILLLRSRQHNRWSYKGQQKGRYGHEGNLARIFSKCPKVLRSLLNEATSRGSSRDL